MEKLLKMGSDITSPKVGEPSHADQNQPKLDQQPSEKFITLTVDSEGKVNMDFEGAYDREHLMQSARDVLTKLKEKGKTGRDLQPFLMNVCNMFGWPTDFAIKSENSPETLLDVIEVSTSTQNDSGGFNEPDGDVNELW